MCGGLVGGTGLGLGEDFSENCCHSKEEAQKRSKCHKACNKLMELCTNGLCTGTPKTKKNAVEVFRIIHKMKDSDDEFRLQRDLQACIHPDFNCNDSQMFYQKLKELPR